MTTVFFFNLLLAALGIVAVWTSASVQGGCSLVAAHRLLMAVASLIAEPGLEVLGLQ